MSLLALKVQPNISMIGVGIGAGCCAMAAPASSATELPVTNAMRVFFIVCSPMSLFVSEDGSRRRRGRHV